MKSVRPKDQNGHQPFAKKENGTKHMAQKTRKPTIQPPSFFPALEFIKIAVTQTGESIINSIKRKSKSNSPCYGS